MVKQRIYAGRRPAVSEKPAIIIGASPCMIRYVVTVMLIAESDTPRSSPMRSNAGKYILPVYWKVSRCSSGGEGGAKTDHR